MKNILQDLFFVLLRAGLWEKDVRLSNIKDADYREVYRLASEQSVVGMVAAGLEHLKGKKASQEVLLSFMGDVLLLEQKNKAMNVFIAKLVQNLRSQDVYSLLLKGQGIAQNYERPLWRACGDVDLFLSEDNYRRAKNYLSTIAQKFDKETSLHKHIGYSVDGWVVELHGKLACGMSRKIDKCLGEIYQDTFYGGNVRSWDDKETKVFMLSPENDMVYVFVHFLNHFYKGGIGLRQICDWCRILWSFRDSLNRNLLESRIRKAGLMMEWKAFGAFAVDWLGMPTEAMPFYSSEAKWSKKAVLIKDFIMEVGNFGHNRDASYYSTKPFTVRKSISFWMRVKDLYHHARIFPLDSIRFFWGITVNGVKAAVRGE